MRSGCGERPALRHARHEVHRFDMHAPKRLKSNRTAVRAHAVANARRTPFGDSTAFSSAAVSTLSGANSVDVLYVCTGLQRSADGAPPIKLVVERSCFQ